MKRNFFRYSNPVWAILGALLFLLVFSWSTSPLYLVYGIDSPFFEIIGMGICEGKVPYVDLFDHKGPLLFFINALGFSVGLGKLGLFLLQWVFFSITLMLLYAIARIFVTRDGQAFGAVLLALIPLADFFCEGNQCEEWMLPFEAVSLWMACKWITDGCCEHRALWSLVHGLCFGVLFCIRPNDGVMWTGGIYFGLFLLWFANKQYRTILPNVLMFLVGFALVCAPLVLYFYLHDAIPDLIYGMFIHNIKYTADALFTMGGIGMVVIPILIIGVCILLSNRSFDRDTSRHLRYIYIPVLVLTLLLIGKRDYYHYLIPLIPFVVICFALCKDRGWKAFLWISCILFAMFSYRQVKTIVKAWEIRDDLEVLYSQTDSLFDIVPEEERNQVWNYNLSTYVVGEEHSPHLYSLLGAYIHRGVSPGNAAFVPFEMDYDLVEGYKLQDKEPKWLLMQPEDYFNEDFDYINQNYELIAATPSEPVCEVRLYRKKD